LEEQPNDPGFLSAFARRHWLLGHPVPAREFRFPHGRPTGTSADAPDSVEVPVFRTHETRPGWAPSLLRGGGVLPTSAASLIGACRFPTASPIPRWNLPPRGAADNRAYEDSLAFTRPAFPSPVTPGWNGCPSAFSWASHPAVTRDARQDRDDPTDTGPDHTFIIDYLQTARSLNTCDITSHGCLQLHPTATTARRWAVSHPHPEHQRLVAHVQATYDRHSGPPQAP
jgi:hypothetical protein